MDISLSVCSFGFSAVLILIMSHTYYIELRSKLLRDYSPFSLFSNIKHTRYTKGDILNK